MKKFPVVFKQEIPAQETFTKLNFFKQLKINTVCASAHCPNLSRCFKAGCATFMLLGDTCTRNCFFCAVKKGLKPDPVDPAEVWRILEAAKGLRLKYIVITSVTRDDLEDGGAGHFAGTVEILRSNIPEAKIELLVPDFQGNDNALEKVIRSSPDVLAHNLETVPRLYPQVRPGAKYAVSLKILEHTKRLAPNMLTKSSLMLGMGEKEEEVIEAFKCLARAGCDILTLGQYLSPSPKHYPLKEFITSEQFEYYRSVALALGLRSVLAGPLVRSSYKAEEIYLEIEGRGKPCTI
ncbi:MAG: lipoyl synthase [Candidatus Omnitrophica bacterium]|nr:lipoyl synthase [Candidatus Omnitrophota bacterium]MDD5236348.1 lipoyl synthase [Candidatus Omnitrophota bacterium]MDD5610230.1 lipoyl synthase [Candidatus Omnitrophota bacterium]